MNKRLDSLLNFLPEEMRKSICAVNAAILEELEEIRIRVGQPVILLTNQQEMFLKNIVHSAAYIPQMTEMKEILERVTQNSFYAYLEDIRHGFITVEGGHRIGIGGTCVVEQGKIANIKEIAFINIRVAHERKGISDALVPHLLENGSVKNTLIISPPQAGKTTLLRDITRNLSNQLQKGKIVLIDERGEIAAAYHGIPQNDVGMRTDVLTGVPKREGMFLAIRSLSPTVLITDELGSCGEVETVFTALHSGVRIITTVHGNDEKEIMQRADLKPLFHHHVFRIMIVLGASHKNRIMKILSDGEQI